MTYTFNTYEGEPATFEMRVRGSVDSYTLTAEFTEHRYDQFKTQPVFYSKPLTSAGPVITMDLTEEEVDLIGTAHFRIRASKPNIDLTIDTGKLNYAALPPIAEVRGDDLYLVDALDREFRAGTVRGPQGPVGPMGLTGPQGPVGNTGAKGDTGATGPVGPKGDKGDQGDVGTQGIQGIQGLKGDKGDPGDLTPAAVGAANGSMSFGSIPLTATRVFSGNVTSVSLPTVSSSVSGTITLILKQAASGGPYTITWPSNITWAGGAPAPAMPTAANARLAVNLFWTGQEWLGMVGGTFF